MATPGIPTNFTVQTGNAQVLASWDLTAGATSYVVQRSEDNVTFTTIATVSGSPLATSYLDTTVTLGTQYWYRVAASSTSGSVTFAGNPNPGDTLTLNGVVYKAVASGATGLQFNIASLFSATILNLSQLINATVSGEIAASATSTQLLLAAFTSTATLVSALTNTTVSPFTSGSTGLFTQALFATPAPTGEMTLSQIRLQAQQRADRVNSNFVSTSEWSTYINQAMFELYDLLITVYEDYFTAPPIQFVSDGVTYLYPLPNGSNTFLNALNLAQTVTPPPYYKLLGVDVAIQNTINGYATVNKFNFIERNRFVYPNTASTIYGVFNLQYRVMGSNIMFIPTPSAGQGIRLWYIPRLPQLLQDTDTTVVGISGWVEYIIVRAAKYALDKEESDTTKLDQELLFLKGRIEESAANRDAGIPDKISNTRANNGYWGNGMDGGWSGSTGGF